MNHPDETYSIVMGNTQARIERQEEIIRQKAYVLGYIYSALNGILQLPDENLRDSVKKLHDHVEECVNILFYSKTQEEE